MTGKPLSKGHEGRKYSVDGWDMGRMLKFIEQESEQKAQEIRIKANEEYALEVAEKAVRSLEKINRQKTEEMNKIKSEKIIAEGKLRAKANITIAKEKEKIVRRILIKATENSKGVLLSRELAEEAVKKFKFVNPQERMIIYVRNEDRNILKKILREEEYSVEEMSDSLIGGIVIRNEGRTVLVDNSYLERIRKTVQNIQPIIQKFLFNVEGF